MFDEANKRLARNLAEVIEQLWDIQRPRERRIELIQHHVERAIIIGRRRDRAQYREQEKKSA
jgi:hypothetical protein